jgi:hypothetical protein
LGLAELPVQASQTFRANFDRLAWGMLAEVGAAEVSAPAEPGAVEAGVPGETGTP